MDLIKKINADLLLAMKRKDGITLRTLRSIKTMVTVNLKDKNTKNTDMNELAIKVIYKAIKQREDSSKIYKEQNREDLFSKENDEIIVLKKYLPTQLTDSDLENEVIDTITHTNANSLKDMGKVMKILTEKLSGKATPKRISAMVKQQLS